MDDSVGFGYWGKTSEEILKNQFPLHCACRDGDVEALSLLLVAAQHGIYTEDGFYGWTPAHWASYFGKLNCLMCLLEHGMNCDATTVRFNQTPAHIAAFGGHSHCLKWLLHCGAAISKQDYLGETPLHKAARTGSMECISLLVSHAAQLYMQNHNGQMPSELARSCGFSECANYLERAVQHQQQKHVHHPGVPQTDNQTKSHTETCLALQGLNGGLIPNGTTQDIGSGDAPMSDIEMETNTMQGQMVVLNGACANGFGNGLHLQNSFNLPISNGFTNGHSQPISNGLSNGHSQPISNGFTNSHSSTVTDDHNTQDVLLNGGVSHNCVPIAGKKRTREDVEEDGPKRMRIGDLSVSEQKFEQYNTDELAVMQIDRREHIDYMYSDVLLVSLEPMKYDDEIINEHLNTHQHKLFVV